MQINFNRLHHIVYFRWKFVICDSSRKGIPKTYQLPCYSRNSDHPKDWLKTYQSETN